jgi:hypothetical protein
MMVLGPGVLGPGRFLKVEALGSQGSWNLGIGFAEGFGWSING